MVQALKQFIHKGRFAIIAGVIALGMSAAVNLTGTSEAPEALAYTCKNTSILYCGVPGSTAQGNIDTLRNYYNSNTTGHSASPTLKRDYKDSRVAYDHFGANQTRINAMNTSNTKRGIMYRDGRVYVGGELVGKDALTVGRFKTSGSYQIEGASTTLYVRKPAESFVNDKLDVIVYFEGGKMVFGSVLDCGNPIKATPVVKPVVKPVEQPKPQTLVCRDLSIRETDIRGEYVLRAEAATTNGATVKSYTFDFGDDTANETVTSNALSVEVNHTYAPGTYTAKVTANGVADGKSVNSTNADCEVPLTVEQPETPPAKEVTPPAPVTPVVQEMPKTGPASLFALFSGTSALGALGHRFYTKRRMR